MLLCCERLVRLEEQLWHSRFLPDYATRACPAFQEAGKPLFSTESRTHRSHTHIATPEEVLSRSQCIASHRLLLLPEFMASSIE